MSVEVAANIQVEAAEAPNVHHEEDSEMQVAATPPQGATDDMPTQAAVLRKRKAKAKGSEVAEKEAKPRLTALERAQAQVQKLREKQRKTEEKAEAQLARLQKKRSALEKRNAQKAVRAAKKDRPKRAGGTYLFFCNAYRNKVRDDLGPDSKLTQVIAELARRWKELKDDPTRKEELNMYEQQAAEDKKRYEAEMQDYVPPPLPQEQLMMFARRRRKRGAEARSPKKRSAGSVGQSDEPTPEKVRPPQKAARFRPLPLMKLPQEVMLKAYCMGMKGALLNLACRRDIVEKGLAAQELLDVLEQAGGVVSKAQSTILAPQPPVSD
eukprot:gnl/TRDRNA2_/TRDRNA2_187249_c0_seq1.p1 gnl/TRDRNA2_/TRDRNA2_187249_c0~~gnl/TRDRNA2_/TRDRNA2_187249_c0_seq1.p1  ORF type:complete len:324 (-),score=98.86 gnl/TRDRNA2_/TRDRNA2_187249_c0_seq1:75-1046(-)